MGMGLFGIHLGKNPADYPKAPPYRESPMFARSGSGYGSGTVGSRMLSGDEALYQKVMENLKRAPGYDAKTVEDMYLLPAEQSAMGEAASLRRLNQGEAASGRYDSGGRLAGRSEILSKGVSTRADLRRQVLSDAARTALADRYNQLASMEGYVNPRMSMASGENSGFNSYQLGKTGLDLQGWNGMMDRQAEQDRANQEMMWKFFAGLL